MKPKTFLFCLPAAMLMLVACNKAQQEAANDSSTDSISSTEAQNEAQLQDALTQTDADTQLIEQAQMAMLQGLFSINCGEDEEMLRKCCTKNALKQLHDDYEYDDINENSIAIWVINGRGTADLSMVLSSLKKVAPDTYQAEFNEFLDDKLQGTSIMQYKLALEDGQWKIDSYRQTSPN